MSDDARTPEPPDHATRAFGPGTSAFTGDGPGAGPQDAPPAPKVALEKPAPEPDPWAPPADDVPPASGHTGTPPPSVHNQPTVTSMPAVGTGAPGPYGGDTPAAPQPWVGPFASPASGGSAGPYASPGGPRPQTGAAPHNPNPFAPPSAGGPGEPVPPPPTAPGGPGGPLYGRPQYPGYPMHGGHGAYPGGTAGYGWPAPAPMPSNGMGTTSLVLGIIAAAIFCLWPVAILLGILAVIFGVIGRQKARRGEATNPGQALAGIICGAVGLVLAIGLAVLIFALPDDGDDDPYFGDDGYSTSLVAERLR